MTETIDVWGFSDIIIAGDGATSDGILEACNAGATARGIDPAVRSDALDASRDVIVAEATDGRGEVLDGTLYVSTVPGLSAAQLKEMDDRGEL